MLASLAPRLRQSSKTGVPASCSFHEAVALDSLLLSMGQSLFQDGLLQRGNLGAFFTNYFHIALIRAPTSMRICCALRSEAAADTSGQVIVSKNCSKVAGMNRVLAA